MWFSFNVCTRKLTKAATSCYQIPVPSFVQIVTLRFGTGTRLGIRDKLNFRFRRDIPTITNPDNQALNELARYILTSMESALVANEDGGACLRRSICECNKYSRTLEGRSRIWIPVWGWVDGDLCRHLNIFCESYVVWFCRLGLSWLSGQLTDVISSTTSILEGVRASVLGLGRANCDVIYQSCDLRGESKNRRRRRKRSQRN